MPRAELAEALSRENFPSLREILHSFTEMGLLGQRLAMRMKSIPSTSLLRADIVKNTEFWQPSDVAFTAELSYAV